MTSEIKVDTISEQTSANGVTIDGLTIKDGNIQGSPALVGTTPSFTIGDGGAEDTKIVFDGNALDYYIGLDDSADNLIIGSGSTVGSNSLITIDSDGDFTLDSAADITLDVGGGDISLKGSGAEYGKFNLSGNSLNIHSSISDGDIVFKGNDGGSTITALTLDMSGGGQAIFLKGATFNDHVYFTDGDKAVFGGANDLQIYHDGTNSYISDQGTNDLKILATDFQLKNAADDEFMMTAVTNGSVELYHNNVKQFLTSSTGINLPVDGESIKFGADSEVLLTHVHNSGLQISHAGNGDTLTLLSTDDDASVGPRLLLQRNSSSPADNDLVGEIQFKAEDSSSNADAIFNMSATMVDVTGGTEDMQFTFKGIKGGSLTEYLKFKTENVVFNDDSNDIDFRVESNNNAFMLFVDGGNDHVNVGTSTDHGGVFNVESTDNAITLLLASTDTDANQGPQLKLLRAVTGADNDICGRIEFGAKDDAGNGEAYALITQKILTAAHGSEEGRLTFQVMEGGSQRDMLSLDASEVVINEDSRDIDFRVESDSKTHMLFVDSGNDRIGVNTNAPADTMHIKSTGDPSGDIRLILETNATDGNCALDFRNSASTYKGGILYDTDDNNFKFFTNGSNQRMTIKASGTFGFGRTESQTAQNSFAHFYGGEHSYFAYRFENQETSSNNYTMQIFNNLTADNNSSEFFRCQDGGAVRLIIFADGDVQNHDNAYGSISDERIKQDIRDSNSQWDDIKAVRVRNFKKKDDVRQYGDDAWEQIGVVAQELEAVSPKLVRQGDPTASDILSDSSFGTLWTADDPETQDGIEDILYTADDQEVIDGDKNVGDVKIQGKQSTEKIGDVKEVKEQVKSVNYSVLYMKAVKALQEAQTRIETLETKVAALEG